MIHKPLFIFLILLVFLGCDKSPAPTMSNRVLTNTEDAFKENYKFYPLNNTNVWYSDHYYINPFPRDTVKRSLITRHNTTTQQTTTMYGNDTFSYNWFTNFRNKLAAGDMIYIDYSLLDECSGDSVLIYSDVMANGTTRKRYQYCNLVKPITNITQYQSMDCIKSKLINTFANGSKLEFTSYFAKNVGVVSQISIVRDASGEILSKEMRFLRSTNF